MKICIPTETNKGKEATAYGHFGSASFFTIYDTVSGDVEVIDNSNQHHSHGMCQPMSALAGKGVEAVVTGGAGARAVQKLNDGGIRVYRAVSGIVADIARKITEGKLEELSIENACAHHRGCH